jgi:hypothetical protein
LQGIENANVDGFETGFRHNLPACRNFWVDRTIIA